MKIEIIIKIDGQAVAVEKLETKEVPVVDIAIPQSPKSTPKPIPKSIPKPKPIPKSKTYTETKQQIFDVVKDLTPDNGLRVDEVCVKSKYKKTLVYDVLIALINESKIYRSRIRHAYRYFGIKPAKKDDNIIIKCLARGRSIPESHCKPNKEHPACIECKYFKKRAR